MAIPKQVTPEGLREKFEGAKTVVHEYGRLDYDTVIFKLNPDTWSCVEVCQHLIRFNRMYVGQMNDALNEVSKIPVNGDSFTPGWTTRKLASFLEPPYKFGIKTIQPMFPSTVDLDPAETFHELIDCQDQIVKLLDQAASEHWNLDKLKASHPILKFLSFTFTGFLILIDAHQRRHFWQIEQILKRIPD